MVAPDTMNNHPYSPLLPFIITIMAYQLFLALLVAFYGYKGSFLLLNANHRTWLDAPMFLLTHLGDALILTSILGLLFIRKQPGMVILLILVVIITGLAGQLLKNTLFDSWDRPLRAIGEGGEVHTVFGYRLFQNSFPSGHSITVAAAITSLAMILKPGRLIMVLLALFIAIISYTRIYVGAHFAADVLAGTILGIAASLFLTAFLYPRINRWVGKFSPGKLIRLKAGLFLMAALGLIGGTVMIVEFLA